MSLAGRLNLYLAEHGLETPGHLDQLDDFLRDFVHDLKGAEASEINNEGMNAQLAYIEEAVGEDVAFKEIVAYLADEP